LLPPNIQAFLETPPLPAGLRVELDACGDFPCWEKLPGAREEIELLPPRRGFPPASLARSLSAAAARARSLGLVLPLEEAEDWERIRPEKISRLTLKVPPGLGEDAASALARFRAGFPRARIRLLVSGRAADLPALPGLIRAAARAGAARIVLEPVPASFSALARALAAAGELGISLEGIPAGAAVSPPAPERRRPADFLRRRVGPEDFLNGPPPEEDYSLRDCLYPWDRAFISARGEVFPCPAVREEMGRLGEAPLAEIWAGEKFRRFRRELLTPRPPGPCARCPLRPLFRPRRRASWAWSGRHDRFGIALGTGWHPPEGLPFRWSRKEGTILLEGSGETRLELVLTLPTRRLCRAGTVWLDGKEIGRWRLNWIGDRVFHYTVIPASGPRALSLRPDSVSVPADLGLGDDGRELGAAWKGAILRP